ncbi:unnamed protein product [Peniophora sp. CBMAI 1063]|nr:unnamed protein product [Peniophora sp. CBMAI 1063]
MPPTTSHSHRGVRFVETHSALQRAVESMSLDTQSVNPEEYGVPGPHGAPKATVISSGLRSSIPTPHVATLDVAPPLRPYHQQPDPKAPITSSQPATRPPLRTLQLQLPKPFEPITITSATAFLHATVHDVWAALRRFWHSSATREELYALPETEREEVREAHRQRTAVSASVDGLRRRDFLRGAVIMGVQPLNDETIALVLGKTA